MARNYKHAMSLYNEVLVAYEDNKESKMGVLLCDIAFDNEEQGVKLFEYYQILKAQKISNAEENVINIINALDRNSNYFVSIIDDMEKAQADDIDGILYSDFKKLINENDDFKKLFSYAMFSTKIVFVKKADFYEFLHLLIDNGFGDVSMQYIENLKEDITHDSEMQKIIQRALKAEKTSENPHQ